MVAKGKIYNVRIPNNIIMKLKNMKGLAGVIATSSGLLGTAACLEDVNHKIIAGCLGLMVPLVYSAIKLIENNPDSLFYPSFIDDEIDQAYGRAVRKVVDKDSVSDLGKVVLMKAYLDRDKD